MQISSIDEIFLVRHILKCLKLLKYITVQLKAKNGSDKDLSASYDAICYSVHPFTHTGVYKQRHRLPEVFYNMERNKLERIVQELLQVKQLVKVMSAGSKEDS